MRNTLGRGLYVSLLFHLIVIAGLLTAPVLVPVRFEVLQVVHAAKVTFPSQPGQPASLLKPNSVGTKEAAAAPVVIERPLEVPFEIPSDIVALNEIGEVGEIPTAVGETRLVRIALLNGDGVPEPALPALPPALTEPKKEIAEPPPLRIGGQVEPPRIQKQVPPVYPPLAQKARIHGTVVIDAFVNEAGVLEDVSVVSGHPMLIDAALESVRQWRYAPGKLNGVLFRMPIHIEVRFKLTFPQ